MTDNNTTPFLEDNDQTRARREHLARIRELIGNAYPNKFRRSNVTMNEVEGEDTITAIVAKFKSYEPQTEAGARPTPEQLEAANTALKALGDVRISGRLSVPPRVMGKAAFVHLSDGKERLQVYVRRDDVGAMNYGEREVNGWELFALLDHGDFIGVEGFLFITKTGELSVHVRAFEFLAKALLPMPDKMHGISDPEIRQRQRYADLIAGSLKIDKDDAGDGSGSSDGGATKELTTLEVFERRSKIVSGMRRFLDERGYIEVETPMLTPIASGAAARPFKTHHNALDIDLYARIAPELYLKRLLVGGFERVYELNRNFRNEGINRTHNPEFTMLEFYCAYMDVNGMMDLCEELLRESAVKATGGTSVRFGDGNLDFAQPFDRLTMKEAIVKYWHPQWWNFGGDEISGQRLDDPLELMFIAHALDMDQKTGEGDMFVPGYIGTGDMLFEITSNEARRRKQKAIESLKQSHAQSNELEEHRIGHALVRVFESIESRIRKPTFIYNYPKSISPLSKASPDDPSIAERFELFINGMECANGFSELNDPAEQYERFQEQAGARERGDEEAMQTDTDYVRALSYGMPPAAGIGIGIDRLVMLLTNRRSIRDVILFPHLRPAAAARQAEEASEETTGEMTE